MWDSGAFLGALTPKFYVALTGTSSLISGLILIFEWWYFRKYGTSFIEQVSLSQLGPWLGGGGAESGGNSGGGGAGADLECEVCRNPLALLRGAEYARLAGAGAGAGEEAGEGEAGSPLTYYDMNLSAQEHQAWFTVAGAGEVCESHMSRAWRERSPAARVRLARAALAARPDCAPALLLLAEEEAPTVQEAERVLRRAWRCAEAAWRRSAAEAGGGAAGAIERHRRDTSVLCAVRRRLAWCARRLGRTRDAARLLRELCRDLPPALPAPAAPPPHDALLEVLLEQRAYGDAAALLAKLDPPVTATALWTAALLKARAAGQAAATATTSGTRGAEAAARDAIRRALEFNPYVAEYLLEQRPLAAPPEHFLRRGDSEALAYAFWHGPHWRAAEPALRLLAGVAGAGPGAPPARAPADRRLLGAPPPPWRGGALVPVGAVCALTGLVSLALHGVGPASWVLEWAGGTARWLEGMVEAAGEWGILWLRRLHPARLVQMVAAL